jgi:hypothetical protein
VRHPKKPSQNMPLLKWHACCPYADKSQNNQDKMKGENRRSMSRFMQPDKDPERLAHVPEEVAILPLRNTLAYPFSVLPLTVGVARSVKLVEDALELAIRGAPTAKLKRIHH